MVSIMISMEDNLRERLNLFSWINWSSIAREEARKKEIFKKYLNSCKVTNKDWKFCERIDWHPVDELPLKAKYVKELEKRRNESSIIVNSVNEIFDEK